MIADYYFHGRFYMGIFFPVLMKKGLEKNTFSAHQVNNNITAFQSVWISDSQVKMHKFHH